MFIRKEQKEEIQNVVSKSVTFECAIFLCFFLFLFLFSFVFGFSIGIPHENALHGDESLRDNMTNDGTL